MIRRGSGVVASCVAVVGLLLSLAACSSSSSYDAEAAEEAQQARIEQQQAWIDSHKDGTCTHDLGWCQNNGHVLMCNGTEMSLFASIVYFKTPNDVSDMAMEPNLLLSPKQCVAAVELDSYASDPVPQYYTYAVSQSGSMKWGGHADNPDCAEFIKRGELHVFVVCENNHPNTSKADFCVPDDTDNSENKDDPSTCNRGESPQVFRGSHSETTESHRAKVAEFVRQTFWYVMNSTGDVTPANKVRGLGAVMIFTPEGFE